MRWDEARLEVWSVRYTFLRALQGLWSVLNCRQSWKVSCVQLANHAQGEMPVPYGACDQELHSVPLRHLVRSTLYKTSNQLLARLPLHLASWPEEASSGKPSSEDVFLWFWWPLTFCRTPLLVQNFNLSISLDNGKVSLRLEFHEILTFWIVFVTYWLFF